MPRHPRGRLEGLRRALDDAKKRGIIRQWDLLSANGKGRRWHVQHRAHGLEFMTTNEVEAFVTGVAATVGHFEMTGQATGRIIRKGEGHGR